MLLNTAVHNVRQMLDIIMTNAIHTPQNVSDNTDDTGAKHYKSSYLTG